MVEETDPEVAVLPAPGAERGPSRRSRPDARVGQLLDGRFEITRLVARGGMGKIYEGVQQPLGRRVALKVMDLGFAEDLDPDFQKRFFLEASTCAGLSHPNTIRVFDYGSTGEESETYFIAMEFIEGKTLLQTMELEGPLPPLRMIAIARQICSSLAEAHGKGVIHRDLKPSNVLLTSHGEQNDFVKVLDFGLVKLIEEDAEEMTKSGLFLGSPNYMSPEQIKADRIDQRADLYSLGVILFMGLTGKSPFKRNSSVKVLLAQLEDAPPPFSDFLPQGSVPHSLEWVVMTCLEKNPRDRFLTVEELHRALKACEAELRGAAPNLSLSLDQGRLQLPPEHSGLLDSEAWNPLLRSYGTGSSDNLVTVSPNEVSRSLVSDRLRPDLDRARTPSPPAGRTSRSSQFLVLTMLAVGAGLLLAVLYLALQQPAAPAALSPATEEARPPDLPSREPVPSPSTATAPETGPPAGATPAGAEVPSPRPSTATSKRKARVKRPKRNQSRPPAKQQPQAKPATRGSEASKAKEESAPPKPAARESKPERSNDLRDPWGDDS